LFIWVLLIIIKRVFKLQEIGFLCFGNHGRTSKNLIVKSTTFPHCNIHKYTWTSPDGVTHTPIDHVLIDKRQHSNILDVCSFRFADYDTDHYLVVAKLRDRISVNE
jgi:hypothetical protein